jgi:hypothetical protein
LVLVEFEVLIAVVMKSTIFWEIVPCSPLKVNRRFGETDVKAGGKHNSACHPFHVGFLFGVFVDPEDIGDMFFRNVD